MPVGITICEDIWYKMPAARAAEQVPEFCSIKRLPFHQGKAPERKSFWKNGQSKRIWLLFIST